MRIRLDIPLPLSEIAVAVNAPLRCKSRVIRYISTDSRLTQKGDLFFALRGEKADGNNFIDTVRSIGAYTVGKHGDIECDDTAHALLRLAAHYKSTLTALHHTVAITGSVGKSTTKEILSSILSEQFKVHKSKNNHNNILGVSYTVLSAPKNTEILVLELGMNHTGEIEELSRATSPDIAVITNIGTSHIGNLGSKEKIAEAKLEIRAGLKGTLVVPYGEALLEKANGYSFSTSSANADIYLEHSGIESYRVYKRGVIRPYTLITDAEHIARNASAAFSVAELCNFTPSNQYVFGANSHENARQKIIQTGKFDILCDYYNASHESFMSGFKYANSLPYERKSALIGDVLELGKYAKSIHFDIGKAAAEYEFEKLFLFGVFSEYLKLGALSVGFPADKIYINKCIDFPEITAAQIRANAVAGELIYAKASHKLDLGRITDLLKE